MTIEGKKYDSGKRRWGLMPWGALGHVVDVLQFGAEKYGPHNWIHVENARERYTDALLRHVTARQMGHVLDPESGRPHLAHAACCILFLIALETGSDDHLR